MAPKIGHLSKHVTTTALLVLGQPLVEGAALHEEQLECNLHLLEQLQEQAEQAGTRAAQSSGNPAPPTIMLQCMTLDIFEASARACQWPKEEWSLSLLPLLTGDVQVVALTLWGVSLTCTEPYWLNVGLSRMCAALSGKPRSSRDAEEDEEHGGTNQAHRDSTVQDDETERCLKPFYFCPEGSAHEPFIIKGKIIIMFFFLF